ncbi:sodium/proline symporter PutP [Clostridium ganghwense]|uniref:Sodium/proline symporter n=1 Tax=Clostridium ganghwense TaxID=312089 RepID=A0ABT4CPG8_9CLOT|nr:sodium/proline symporter PutP [Clostridium ganghwense]MCY6369976.1 sodium/proline symporter PutP [Clostridium ganghwense]
MFIIYLLAMMAIGLVFYFRTKNLSDYVLGGRQLSGWVTSLSAQASDMSGWLLMGLPGAAYLTGMDSIWIAIGLAVGTYLNWKVIAKRLRVYTQTSGDSLTLPDYFENRFKDNSKILRIISAVFILIFFLFYTSSGFVAGGKLFSTVFGISYIKALTIGAIVIVAYTFLGGFMAVCWTDFFQGIMMFAAVVMVPIIGIKSLGGINETVNAVKSINPNLLNPFVDTKGISLSLIGTISSLAWGIGYFGQPHILVRFMAIKSAKEVKKARMIAMIWVAFSLAAAVIIGMVGLVYLKTPLIGNDSEKVFLIMVSKMFNPVIGGILMAAVLAAVMSTADSQLLVTASSLTEDFYKVLFRKNASEKELVWVSRIAVAIVAIIAYYLALDENSSILNIVSYAWAGFGATFGPTIILSLFWKRMNKSGALAGMITGGITVIVWKSLSGGIFDLYEIVPGFICSVIVIVIVSLLTKEPSEEIKQEFDMVYLKIQEN